MSKSTSKPPHTLSIIETNKNQDTKDGTSQPVFPLAHPLPSGVARGLWAHLPCMYLAVVGRQFSMGLSYFCMPVSSHWLPFVPGYLCKIVSFSQQSTGVLAVCHLRSGSLSFGFLSCDVSYRVFRYQLALFAPPLGIGDQGTSIRKSPYFCYCYCCD